MSLSDRSASRVPPALHNALAAAAWDFDPAESAKARRAAAAVLREMSNSWVEMGEKSGYTDAQASALFLAEHTLMWDADEVERRS